MWVVKIGGSLHDAPELQNWLAALATHGRGRVVIVPGGGPFADQVRAAQQRWGFADDVAHLMAVHAMEQYGLMLTGLEPHLTPAVTKREITDALVQSEVPVWMPVQEVAQSTDLPADWNTTSDSLAAWLARTLDATHLALVKSAPPQPGPHTVASLAEQGVVDRHMAEILRGSMLEVWWWGRQDYRDLEALLDSERAQSGIAHVSVPQRFTR